jgi:hypothetical protein
MIPYVVYSHTEYLDVLNVQTDYLKDYENKYLLINNNEIESEIFSKYKGIIYYDDALTYPSRLLSLNSLTFEHILFIHDLDIVISKNDEIIEKIYKKMIDENIDRVDLQYDRDHRYNKTINNISQLYIDGCDDFYLNKQDCTYSYNVNPSMWKLKSLLNIMEIYKNDNYRNIENTAQQYCKDNYSIFKPYGEINYKSGYFECIYFFKFLHITHWGEYLPLSNFTGIEPDIIEEWLNIVEKFSLKDSGRKFKSNI